MDNKKISYKEIFIKNLSILTEIDLDCLVEYSKENNIINILDHPDIMKLTKEQHNKLLLVKELITQYKLVKSYENEFSVIFTSTQDTGSFFSSLIGHIKDKEIFIISFLDGKNQLIETKLISSGTISKANIHPRDVAKIALNNDSKSIIMCHNHPSGVLYPSDDDIAFTQKISNILILLGIDVLDHIIVNDTDYFSFKENNMSNLLRPYNMISDIIIKNANNDIKDDKNN